MIAGPEPYPQPFPQIASLIANDVWKVAFSAGGGIKFRLIPHMLLRAEFRDYITTFPRQQIVPAPAQHGARNFRAVHSAVRNQLHALSANRRLTLRAG